VTSDEFISGMGRLGQVECREQPDGQVLAVLEPQQVPGTGRGSRVAFMLGREVLGRPQHFVDGDLRTRSGAVPNNWSTTIVGRDVFGTWSFNCPWEPSSDSPEALVLAVLAQWDR
jgi:hypothetical protein